jgi:predicted TIM-barrel fold metal-dependent hydrolase
MTPVSTQSNSNTDKPPLLDSHVHLWHPRQTPREVSLLVRLFGFSESLLDWLAPRLFPKDALAFYGTPQHIVRPYLPATYQQDLQGQKSQGFIHVEASWTGKGPFGPVGETRWLETLQAVGDSNIRAIVAQADLTLGAAVNDVLKAHLAASQRVRGIRSMLAWHPSPHILNSVPKAETSRFSSFRIGYEQLAKHQLSFETSCYDNQLGEILSLARAYPAQPLLLCHMGTPVAIGGQFGDVGRTPDERLRIRLDWEAALVRLSECPNVSVKLSGLTMPICGFGYEHRPQPPSVDELVNELGPLINFVIDTFGPERCMFGSNFPVDKASVPLTNLLTAYHKMVAHRPLAERHCLFHGTAESFYHLSPVPDTQI